jgi:adenine-specific DNA-methyltransferase
LTSHIGRYKKPVSLAPVAAFQFDPEAAGDVDETNWPGVTLRKADTDDELIEAYRGTKSLPFRPGEHRRTAVKIVDDQGIENPKVPEVDRWRAYP